ncbi:PhzF family phenazine biosynthesis protein [Mycobacterium neglectum]|uniref:PhzF family phenazine biosynthesis protein n=1 Tax=Mycobacterium neglectum TaxID=242737 RepID=UPI001FE578E6|nr:PhzF family phenazine biosynthesis protein [Mycobacterium neglectum]
MTSAPVSLAYSHVDVFSAVPFGGNSLPVFCEAADLSAEQMLRITQELRHFEAVFLQPADASGTVEARIFDMFSELPFAGHPIIGAAAVLHHRTQDAGAQRWRFELASKTVEVETELAAGHYSGWLDQGRPEFFGTATDRTQVARAVNLSEADLDPALPMEVVGTGLRYLIVPVRPGALEKARISRDITELLHGFGAQFAVLLDESAVEVRHWNNDGVIEDVATGSAAGTIGAYRLRHGMVCGGETFTIAQGRFTGRPSVLRVRPEGSPKSVESVSVGGDVAFVGHGTIECVPS